MEIFLPSSLMLHREKEEEEEDAGMKKQQQLGQQLGERRTVWSEALTTANAGCLLQIKDKRKVSA